MKQQTFFVKPFFNLNDKEFPAESVVDMPKGSTIRVTQYLNFVFFQVYTPLSENTEMTTRTVRLITEGQAVPADWFLVGSVVLNEVSSDAELDEEDDDEEDDIITVPSNPEEFYTLLTMANVYLSPELPEKTQFTSWRFGR